MNGSRKPLHVMHLMLDLELAGAQLSVCTLAEAWPVGEDRLSICTFHDGPLRHRFERRGIAVEFLEYPRCTLAHPVRYAAELLRLRRELARLARDRRVDLIQTHIVAVLDILALSLKITRNVGGVVWTMHGVDFLPQRPGRSLSARRLLFRILYRLLAGRVTAIVAVSRAVRDSVLSAVGRIGHKITVIENGVALARFDFHFDRAVVRSRLGVAAPDPIILAVARLAPEKGLQYLIEAFPAVLRDHPRARLLIAGGGKSRSELQALAARLNVTGRVRFLGPRDDIPELLAAADLFVLPSLKEGLPLALLEAMAARKPIVATATAGSSEVVDHGETGWLVPAADSSALASAISELLDDPAKRLALGEAAGRQVAERYSVERQAARYLALYRKLCGTNR
jgi:glycosyltransferase involved in cell wall biosynthesis